ncbi:MAG TPA: MBL fold metallo-hydrolase [Acidobacteriota bacterium]|nr:MBL fold metallo-hydrolase [Acidobacteriota bacterium]
MKYALVLPTLLLMAFCLSDVSEKCCWAEAPGSQTQEVTIDILFDNYTEDGLGTTGLWGFACLIRGFEENVLFDTGADGDILLQNLAEAGIKPADISIVVISHEHGDHTGGLRAFLTANPEATVYFPPSFSDNFKSQLSSAGIKMVEVQPGLEICKGLFTTGELTRPIPENGIYFRDQEGLVVVTGCAHPGIVEITARAKALSGISPYFVLGGFHLIQRSDEAVRKICADLKQIGVTKVFPTHCTGDKAREIFKEEFGNNFVAGGMGSSFSFEL